MATEKSIPAWVWVGCGCVGALAAIALVVVGLGFLGFQKAREIGEAMADPEERRREALELLGAEELPPGYHAVLAMSVPYLMEIAVLSNAPPDADAPFEVAGTRGFIFMSMTSFGQQDDELTAFFEGRTDRIAPMYRDQLNVDLEERVANGELSRESDRILWVSHRGRVRPEGGGRGRSGLVTLVRVDCDGGGGRRRIGVWFGPDPTEGATPGAEALGATVADPAELEAFMEPLRPCG